MINLYGENDLIVAEKKYKKSRNLTIIISAVYLLLCVLICVIYALQDYKTPLRMPLYICVLLLTLAYISFVVMYYDLALKKYGKYKDFIKYAIKSTAPEKTNVFIRKEYDSKIKDGVEGVSLFFLEWSEKEHDFFEIQIYLDVKKDGNYFKKGDKVEHIEYSNFLIGYNIVNKQNSDNLEE